MALKSGGVLSQSRKGFGASFRDTLEINSIASRVWNIENNFKPVPNDLDKSYNKYLELKDLMSQRDTILINYRELKSELIAEYNERIMNTKNQHDISKRNIESSISDKMYQIKRDMMENTQEKINRIDSFYKEKLNKHNEEYRIKNERVKAIIGYCEKLIDNFEIDMKKEKFEVSEKDAINEDVEKIFELIKFNANKINELESAADESEIINIINGLDDKKTKIASGSALLTTIILAPVAITGLVFLIGKQSMKEKKLDDAIKRLTNEMAKCYKILLIKKEDLKREELINKPDGNPVKDEIHRIKSQSAVEIRDNELLLANEKKMALENLSEEGLEENINNIKKEGESLIKEKDEIILKKIEELNSDISSKEIEIDELVTTFMDRQETLKPNLLVDKETSIFERKKGLMDNIRKYDDYKLYSTFEFVTELKEGEIMTEDLAKKIEYDKKLLDKLKKIETEIKELESQGLTKEVLQKKYNEVISEETSLYMVSTSNLNIGTSVLSPKYLEITKKSISEYSLSLFCNNPVLMLYKDEKELDICVNFIKYITYQVLVNNHTESLVVNIVNPEGKNWFNDLQINRDYISEKETSKGKKVVGPAYVKSFNTMENVSILYGNLEREDNVRTTGNLGRKSFEEIVKTQREKGGIVPKYNINILVDLPMDNMFKRFNETRNYKGIVNLHLISRDKVLNTSFDEEKGKISEKVDYNIIKAAKTYSTIIEIIQKEDKPKLAVSYYEGEIRQVVEYIPYSGEFFDEVNSFIKKRSLKTKKVFDITSEFLETVIPKENYWKGNAEETISLSLGFVNGDKSNGQPIILDEVNKPHIIFCGTTGGGKSNVLAVIINGIKLNYNPLDVDVVYVDCKVVEVALHSSPYKMPQCSAMCGSNSPEYLVSILKYVREEMDRRYSMFSKTGASKLSEFRKSQKAVKAKLIKEAEDLEKEGKVDEANEKRVKAEKVIIPPRMLLVIDEVSQPFQSEDDTLKETIKDILLALGQLARAAGIHMFLLSQDVDKIPAQIVNLISGRGCTRAPAEISNSILKSDFCSRPENDFTGFFGVLGDGGEIKQYVVPYNNPTESAIYSKIADNLCASKGFKSRDAVIFNDKDIYRYDLFEKYLKENEELLDGQNVVMGEGVYFQPNGFKPHMIRVRQDDRSSIVIASTNSTERGLVLRTVLRSLLDYAQVYPHYCKYIPKGFEPEVFEKGYAGKRGWFRYSAGKDMIKLDKAIELIKADKFDQFFKNDIFVLPQKFDDNGTPIKDPRKDEVEGFNNTSSFVDWINYEIMMRKEHCLDDVYPPQYHVIFDFTKHQSFLDNRYAMWKSLAQLANEASRVNIHFIFVDTTLDYKEKEIGGIFLVTNNQSMQDIPKEFKKISLNYCKIFDVSTSEGVLVKIPRKLEETEIDD